MPNFGVFSIVSLFDTRLSRPHTMKHFVPDCEDAQDFFRFLALNMSRIRYNVHSGVPLQDMGSAIAGNRHVGFHYCTRWCGVASSPTLNCCESGRFSSM